jgi:hypothetical protein
VKHKSCLAASACHHQHEKVNKEKVNKEKEEKEAPAIMSEPK